MKRYIILSLFVLTIRPAINLTSQERRQISQNVRQTLESGNCDGCDLRHADLSNKNLANISVENADLRYANLSNSNVRNGYFVGTKLQNAKINNIDGAQSRFINTNLNNAQVRNARLNDAQFLNISAQGTDFSGTNFFGIQIDTCNFTKANFTGADFQGASIKNPIFKDAILTKTQFGSTFTSTELFNIDICKKSIAYSAASDIGPCVRILVQKGALISPLNTFIDNTQANINT